MGTPELVESVCESAARVRGTARILSVRDLKKYFPIYRGMLLREVGQARAVDGVSFAIHEGETFGLVGESGCGKTTIGRLVVRLVEPTFGEVLFRGEDIMKLGAESLRALRSKMQIVFQDPVASLNARMTVGQLIAEPMQVHHMIKKGNDVAVRVGELLELVGLPSSCSTRYPHEFSGGQRQRVGIARALSLDPQLLVLDEPVSGLDVSIQSQVINLLEDLQERLDLSYLFISHDIGVVRHVCDRIGVLYLGKLAEVANKDELFANPMHPYTQALLAAVPVPDPSCRKKRALLGGDLPGPLDRFPGCLFNTRCSRITDLCNEEEPQLRELAPGHWVSCHRASAR